MAMDKGLQGAIAAKLLNEREEVEERSEMMGLPRCPIIGRVAAVGILERHVLNQMGEPQDTFL